jgi:putative toxin-antitoxin system antitoxin component (TIGR02293 family)
MAGNKKLQATNGQSIGKGSGHTYPDEHAQTGTLRTSKPAASRSSSADRAHRANAKSTGPFNFESLTSQYKIGIIKNGISKKQLEAIKSETDFDYRTLSNLLSVSRTTLIKKKGDEKFDRPTSERIMLLAELISYGRAVFETRERFNTWLKNPSVALGDQTPLELLDTVYGIEEIKKELGRVEHGIH